MIMFEGYEVPPTQITVRPATSRDVADVARLHVTAINEGFLSSLGAPFLRRLYARIIESPDGFLVVATGAVESHPGSEPVVVAPEPVLGFVAGASSVRRLYRQFLWRDGAAAALAAAPSLARSLPRVLETLRYGLGREHTTSAGPDQFSNDPPEEAELLAIAVTDRSRRHGAGAALVGAFLSTAAQMGPPSARVIVDAANHGAIALYDRAGFSIAGGLEVHAGTQSVLMRVQLSQPNAS